MKVWSGRRDLNSGPLAPQASALARLRHGPIGNHCSTRFRAAAYRAPENYPMPDEHETGEAAAAVLNAV
jgi:hypothetical protein